MRMIFQEIYTQLLLNNLTRIAINDAEKNNSNKKDEPSFKNAVFMLENYLNEIIFNIIRFSLSIFDVYYDNLDNRKLDFYYQVFLIRS